jgi:hypothetical protein
MNVTEVTKQIGWYSVILLWLALFLRARPALKSHYQRGLWLAVLSVTISITLFQPDVATWMTDVTGNPHTDILIRNLVGVLAAGLTLLFIIDSTHGHRLRLVIALGMTAALLVLIAMDLLADSRRSPDLPSTDGPATPSTTYWVIVCGAHLIGALLSAIICIQYSRRTQDLDLVWSLRFFATGSVLAVGYWAAYVVHVYVRMPQALPYMGVVINIHGVSRALTLLVPTATSASRFARNVRTVWVLWPLWRDLSTAVPNIALVRPQPTRLREILRPRAPIGLQAHRQTIETYDAILNLQAHVREQAYEEALPHAKRIRIPAPRAPAAALAGALGQARRANSPANAPASRALSQAWRTATSRSWSPSPAPGTP